MWRFQGTGRSRPRRIERAVGCGDRPRIALPAIESLEGRQLLTASLAPLADLSVPAQLGYQLALDGSANPNSSQLYTVSSDNPHIHVSIAQGPYWTLTVSHQPANAGDVTINNESLTFQLFQDLAPNTVSRIVDLTNIGFYTNQGKYFPRIYSGFVTQGGSTSATSTSSSSGYQAIGTEPVQQLAYTGESQLGMANTGRPNSTDAQFFITNAVPSTPTQQALDFRYTIFGQLVAGQQTLDDLSRVAVTLNSFNEPSLPLNPVTITSATLSSTNPNGVVHVDTTSARAGETANITVKATDPQDGSQITRTFKVTASAYNGPTSPLINFKPFAQDSSVSAYQNVAASIRLKGQSGFPDAATPSTLSYAILTQPAHGKITEFDATIGSLVYTPDPGYSGTDVFTYQVIATGPAANPSSTSSDAASVRITVTAVGPSPAPPLVTLVSAQDTLSRRRQVTQVMLHFSGAINSSIAGQTANYRLALPGTRGSYTARNARVLRLKSARYDSGTNTVILTPKRPFALTRKVQLQVKNLVDSLGRLIDGDKDGYAGGTAVAYLSRSGATINSLARALLRR